MKWTAIEVTCLIALMVSLYFAPACAAQAGAASVAPAKFTPSAGRSATGRDAGKNPLAGEIRGVTRSNGGQAPLASAQVTVRSADPDGGQTVVSGTDGAFAIEGLAPGHYELTVSKQGFATSQAVGVDLAARQSLRLDVTVGAALPVSAANAAKSNDETEKQLISELEEMKARIAELEAKVNAQLGVNAAASVANASEAPAAATTASISATPASAVSAVAAQPSANVPPGAGGAPVNGTLNAANGQPPSSGASPTMMASSALPIPIPNPTTTLTTDQTGKPVAIAPFSDADWTWMNGNARTKDTVLDTKLFTPEIRADVDYIYDYNHPSDHTIGGSSEIFRSGEFQVTQLGVGGDFHYDNVIARVMTQFGMYSVTTPRNDASAAVGNWDLDNAYRYVSEAYGGYHFNVLHGINVEAGIFMSYVGLFSYYNFDNWAYQPSYVSSNTPWFFNGMRVQIYPTAHLKIEPWLVNGWQSYAKFNGHPSVGAQIDWRPTPWFRFVGNQYAFGTDTLGNPNRTRYHTDDSIEIKYYDNPGNGLDKMAFSLTGDLGCETGGGVSCDGDHAGGPKQSFIGFMAYDRLWFHRDKFGLTLGGGEINNPGRYLVLLPPINGATAISGTPYFSENPGDPFKAWDASGTIDYMPSQYITFRIEFDHRAANVPYFTGPGGITPAGGDQGAPGSLVEGFTPDLRKIQNTINMALLVKF